VFHALVTVMLLAAPVASADERVTVPAGRFAPLFGLDVGQRDFPVAAFQLARRPVTRAQFLTFLSTHPKWARRQVNRALADERYLDALNGEHPASPVTQVSYFAASAYCEAQGGRLPSTLEWEYAAAADETRADASRSPDFVQRILDWYGRPNGPDDLQQPGSPRNVYGVEALHGLVWEWTSDFNALFVSGDNRQDGDASAKFMCGSGSTGSANREDYAAFMRYALRSSLKPNSTLPRLGFRCAWDVKETSP